MHTWKDTEMSWFYSEAWSSNDYALSLSWIVLHQLRLTGLVILAMLGVVRLGWASQFLLFQQNNCVENRRRVRPGHSLHTSCQTYQIGLRFSLDWPVSSFVFVDRLWWKCETGNFTVRKKVQKLFKNVRCVRAWTFFVLKKSVTHVIFIMSLFNDVS
jgi:hypothetical protein